MTMPPFDLERLRLDAARSLPAHCFDDFQRLSRTLLHGPAFQWLLIDAPHEGLRRQVMTALDGVLKAAGLRVNRLPLSERIADVATLESRLLKNAAQADVVHVIGRPGWFDAARWDAFNVRRERIAAGAKARLVFWLDAAAIEAASRGAPDLWAWRSGVYRFVPLTSDDREARVSLALPTAPTEASGVDSRSMAERYRRIAEIGAWIDSHPQAPDDLLVAPFDELGRLLFDLGDFEAALRHWRSRELPLHRRRRDDRDVAIVQGKIADILQTRGQLDEAQRILQGELLPVFDRLGDVRSKAVTMGKIADILQARGQLDEALRILQEELLPVFDRLGDVRSKAVAMGRIADILQARGQLDEALRIRQEEELPAYELLGDVRSKAVTMGQIADILRARGQLDEALRIRQEEQLPVFERLGNVRDKAVTMGKIASILQARGQLDEALRILREELLPVFDRMGDVWAKAVTMGQIADILRARGQLDEALCIWQVELLPVLDRLGDLWSKAVTMGKIADILQDRGQLDEALRIRQEEELPVYERLGDVRAKAITQWKVAHQLWQRAPSDRESAKSLFTQALADLRRLRLPEADALAQEMSRLGLPTAPD